MRLRTFVGILLALVAIVAVASLTQRNIELLDLPFQLSDQVEVPLYVALLAVFLLGFLPVVSILLVQTLKRDLAQRRQRRLDREAKSLRGSFRRAVDFQDDGQLQRAGTELEAVLADQPEDFGTLLRYGEVLRHLDRVDEAIDVHRRAAVLYPQSVAVLYQLVDDYESRGESEVAEEIRDRILRDFPGSGLRVLLRRRDEAVAKRNWDDVGRWQNKIESLLDEAGQQHSARDEWLRDGLAYEHAVSLLESDRISEAREMLEQLISRQPSFLPALLVLGEAELLEGKEQAAVDKWRKAWAATASPTFLQRIEDHFIERESPMEAIETLREIIAESEDDLMPRFFLGQLYARLEMPEEATRVLAGLSDRLSRSRRYHYLMGRLRERRGETRAAADAYLKSLQLDQLDAASFSCARCQNAYDAWQAYCDQCGNWNCVEFALQAEPREQELPQRGTRPEWPVYGTD